MPWFDFWRGPETVVFGHWATRGRVDLPLCKGLDTGCVYGGRLTCIELESGTLYQVSFGEKVVRESRLEGQGVAASRSA